jgi:hypothetical protein
MQAKVPTSHGKVEANQEATRRRLVFFSALRALSPGFRSLLESSAEEVECGL